MGDAETLLAGLDPEQRAAVEAPRGPVCVLAGAGTGKTRTITHRIAYLVHRGLVAPGQVLAVSFTSRAAGEMRTRLRELGVHQAQARTFHAATMKQLRYFWPRVIGGDPWQLIDGKMRAIAQAARRAGMSTETEMLRDLAGEIDWAKSSLVAPVDYPAAAAKATRDLPAAAEQIVTVYQTYEKLKSEARMLDFNDYLLHTAAVFEEHPEVATEFRDRYRCFVVDEYQDVTPLQQRVLEAWLGGRDDLTVVGDANQTIYSFAGAAPHWLLNFPRRYPEAVIVRLERDYRSTPEVVSLANQVISAARDRPSGSRLKLIGQRPKGPRPHFAEFDDEPAEARAVARRIGKLMKAGVPASEIAVLFRVNGQSEVYEQALTEADIPYLVRGGERFFNRPEVRQAMQAIRAAVLTRPRPRSADDEFPPHPVDAAFPHHSAQASPAPHPANAEQAPPAPRAANAPSGSRSADAANASSALHSADAANASSALHSANARTAPAVHSAVATQTSPAPHSAEAALPPRPAPSFDLVSVVRQVLAPLGLTPQPPAGGAARERWESLAGLVRVADELLTALPEADLRRYSAELEARAEAQHPPTVAGVTLASMHAAKGLEWDAVFLVGLVEGTLPIQHAIGDSAADLAAIEEERRLFYVGITRAREHLWLSWALSRAEGGKRYRRRSRFLNGLMPEDHPAALPARAVSVNTVSRQPVKPGCRGCGGALVGTTAIKLGRCAGCPSTVDEELLARLLAWRGARAKQLKVPPYVVFTDATLTAIAEQRPADDAALVSISGIGATKLTRFGADVLALVHGAQSSDHGEDTRSGS
ncbi:ATP-dependent DNA helicase UvrD2 [Crossiella sp. SN42]|uniref:ATP-dependent DNA helicase UvrD2 n=1 Tax=Crossiella sp. SN42 TaxID=2944808 RepID=UPI00207CC01A|nr:ATP-dependent DNA helicase UvrD2 [Crossiella sp. SN42]MCO1578125.1 ATP-dependent DNA helicase UvrD2 [Crossiella sp. SN42]